MNRDTYAIVAAVVFTSAAAGMLLRRAVATPERPPAPTPPHLRLVTTIRVGDSSGSDSERATHR